MRLRLVVGLTAMLALVPVVARAQSLPATPAAAECVVEPRPISFFEPLVADLLASTPAASPVVTLPVVEEGDPADAEAEAVALLRQALACVNAGDFPRLAALLTDDGARDAVLVGWGASIRAVSEARVRDGGEAYSAREILDIMVGPGSLLSESSPGALVAVRVVRELSDGRVVATAIRTAADGSEFETLVVFERVDGQLRVVGETVLTLQGTPIA